MKTFVLSLGLLLAGICAHAQGFLKRSGTQIVNGNGEPMVLRGIGLGGWMLQEGYMLKIYRDGQQYRIRERIEALVGPARAAEFYDRWLANHTTAEDIMVLKKWGFNSVRLPMHFNLYTLPAEKEPVKGQDTWLDKGFAMTDALLAWCKANEMYLILDLHAAPGGQGNDLNISDRDPAKPSLWESPENQRKTVALWRKLAERYKNEPWIGAYDIINEPNWGFSDPAGDRNGTKEKDNAPLRKLMMEITAAIREVDNKHIVIIEGNGWGNNYNGVFPPWDSNMVLSYHKYWNFNDPSSIRHMLEAREKYNIPVWVGETGENSNVWFTEAVRLLENHGIGWAWWPLKKIGINNPLEIVAPEGYAKILQYWADSSAPRPDAEQAWAALKNLAEATNIRRNIPHRDVVDALLRQPADPSAKPLKAIRLLPSMEIAADLYDLGANGFAYYDTDTANYRVSDPKRTGGNRGGASRNDGVDIARDSAGAYITQVESGEWTQYTMVFPQNKPVRLWLTVRSGTKGGKVSLWVDGKPLLASVSVPAGPGWTDVPLGTVKLPGGPHSLRVHADEGGFEWRWLKMKQQGVK
ncbi:cellulase family glycosylhydrolase [Chitinophaga caseinilytica]|uniref:Cellulase family glycosylhydrolase n=1 Tax=Chitinophaga caseinilytica TaxID=2267521 RepID=A0ABZ2YXD9_9BACT